MSPPVRVSKSSSALRARLAVFTEEQQADLPFDIIGLVQLFAVGRFSFLISSFASFK